MRVSFFLLYAFLIELFRKFLMVSNDTIKLIFMPGINKLRNFNAKVRLYAEFVKAKRKIPAYKEFLRTSNFNRPRFRGLLPIISDIPVCDKENYIKKYSLDERCVHGRIPRKGVVIDESSGCSGKATNWVRGQSERKRNGRFIKFGAQNLLGTGPLLVINAFALGPWATGMNITMSCLPFSKLKSTGPDKIKIENTLLDFGSNHKYLILGYPPFLKMLITDSIVNWKDYDVTFIVGGESMSEGMREYIIDKGIKNVYSSFGASDLELNIASENDFTISVRKLLIKNASLRNEVLKYSGAVPMVFQFNPADFYCETNENGELLISICRPGYVSPKIRYNIKDKGHVMEVKDLYSILKKLNVDESELVKPSTDIPMLFHYGRADMSVSFFGSNISPLDIQETIHKLPALANIVNSFCIKTEEDDFADKKLVVTVELFKEHRVCDLSDKDKNCLQHDFYLKLSETNQDFREAKRMSSSLDCTKLEFCDFGTGEFANADIRIKAKYFS